MLSLPFPAIAAARFAKCLGMAALIHVAFPSQIAKAETVAEPLWQAEGSVDLVSDYRYRGLSASDYDLALQGEIRLEHRSGLFLDAWGSLAPGNGDSEPGEIDASIGWTRPIGSYELELSANYYMFPASTGTNFIELAAGLSREFGPATLSAEVSYAPAQSAIGGQDNVYFELAGEMPVRGTPFTVIGTVGFEDGALAQRKFDWSLGASARLHDNLELGVHYVDSDNPGAISDSKPGVFLRLSRHFGGSR